MGIGPLRDLVGEWRLAVDMPGAEDVRGQVLFETMGELLVERTTVPVPQAPDSCCVVVAESDGSYVQHYFDSRGVARLYAMTFDGRTWTLQRSKPDFSALEFHQRFVGSISDDGATIDGEWHTSHDGRQWTRDFGLTYTRIGTSR
ncbi:MAG TPA: hypothetical protein VE441_12660 [Mycobacterium sp.]|nr:hypothetical protein [Mycobacterium sp.]